MAESTSRRTARCPPLRPWQGHHGHLRQDPPSGANPSITGIMVVEWGISFDGSRGGHADRLRAVTTTRSAQPSRFPHPVAVRHRPNAALCAGGHLGHRVQLGFAHSEGTPSAEGSITLPAGDVQLVAPTNQYLKQWPLGREFVLRRRRVSCGPGHCGHGGQLPLPTSS